MTLNTNKKERQPIGDAFKRKIVDEIALLKRRPKYIPRTIETGAILKEDIPSESHPFSKKYNLTPRSKI